MRRGLILLALSVFLVALLGAVLSPRSQEERMPLPAPPADGRPMVGFAFSFHYPDKNFEAYLQAVDLLADLGFNSMEVVTPAFQTNGASSKIRIDEGPGRGPTRQQLVKLLRRGRERGMHVALMPIVLFSHPRGNEWRGKINPDSWEAWWTSYRGFIEHFVEIANEGGATAFSVGSELLSTETQERRWNDIIRLCRERYKGKLYYSTNWDHYWVPKHWKHLDMIGINAYWDMAEGASSEKPNPDELARAWRGIRGKVLNFAAEQGKPVLFTEVGYPSLPWGLKDPWNYVNTAGVKADHDVQARGYAAFLRGWSDKLGMTYRPPKQFASDEPARAPGEPADASLAGVFFYSWEYWPGGGDDDIGYGVRGKPTIDLLVDWLKQNKLRPGPASQPAGQAATPPAAP